MEATQTIYELAGEAYGWFEERSRPDGEAFVTLKDGRPEWLYELVREAHGDMLPDNWRYACIRSAFGWIHDNEPDDEDSHEFADSEVDVYTASRFEWLSSNLTRQGYVNEAVSEYGTGDDFSIADAIGLGQYAEASEVYAIVYSGLEDVVTA